MEWTPIHDGIHFSATGKCSRCQYQLNWKAFRTFLNGRSELVAEVLTTASLSGLAIKALKNFLTTMKAGLIGESSARSFSPIFAQILIEEARKSMSYHLEKLTSGVAIARNIKCIKSPTRPTDLSGTTILIGVD